MADENTINELKATLQRLEEERRQLDELYQAVATTLSYLERAERTEGQPGDGISFPARGLGGILQGIRPRGRDRRERNAGDIRDAMEEVLKSEGPLHRRKLYERLVERGWSIGGDDPVNNMSARLSMDRRFTSLGNGVWGLAEALNNAEPPNSYGDSSDDDDNDADLVDDGEDSNTEEEDSVPW